MLNRFLSTFGALALFALLVGFGTREPGPTRDLARSICQIPITHHFTHLVTSVGPLSGGGPFPTVVVTMPPEAGLGISQISVIGGANYSQAGALVVNVNGTPKFKIAPTASALFSPTTTIVPPLILPPGATVEVGHEGTNGVALDILVTGYTLEPAYFGGP